MSKDALVPGWMTALDARIAAHPSFVLEPLREGEMSQTDWQRVRGWTHDEAKKQIRLMLERGEIELVGPRKNYRADEQVASGKVTAYRFVDKDNGGAKPIQPKAKPKNNRHKSR